MLIGLTGRMGAGKDTVCERLKILCLPEKVTRKAFADPLKDSVCALFGITRAQLDEMKVSKHSTVKLSDANCVTLWSEFSVSTSMREFLQRYGTEAHRGIFGENFWLDATLPVPKPTVANPYKRGLTVITDCRFPNEAERVRQCGGRVFEVVGPDGLMSETAPHASERALPAHLLDGYINNSARSDAFALLDESLRRTIGSVVPLVGFNFNV